MAAPSGSIDPTKPAKYPIILSDALLGKSSKEAYTGVRYNHKPALPSDAATTARLKKSAREGTFNLGRDVKGERYQFNGTRTSDDNNYVLIFDPARKAFVLHRLDSMFHMNITKTPTDSLESLRKKFPRLEVNSTDASGPSKQEQKQQPPAKGKGKGRDNGPTEKAKPSVFMPKGKPKDKGLAATKAATAASPQLPAPTPAPAREPSPAPKPRAAPAPASKAKKAKPEKKAPAKPVELPLPTAAPARKTPALPLPSKPAEEEKKKPKRRARSPVESEEEDDSDDGGLIVEFPDGNPPPFQSHFNPAFPAAPRRFSEFVRNHDEDEDADGEVDDGIAEDEDFEMEDVKLPSPVNRQRAVEQQVFTFESNLGEDDGIDEGDVPDLEADLEAELEKEFMMADDPDEGPLSEESEEE